MEDSLDWVFPLLGCCLPKKLPASSGIYFMLHTLSNSNPEHVPLKFAQTEIWLNKELAVKGYTPTYINVMLPQNWSLLEASFPFLWLMSTLNKVSSIWGQVELLRRLSPYCAVSDSLDVRLEYQIPDPHVLIHIFLENSLIFLRLSFPTCKISILLYIERGGFEGTKQAFTHEGSSG